MKKLLKHLQTKMLAGVLVILPLGITFLVLKFVFNTFDSILGPLVPEVTDALFDRDIHAPGLGIMGFLILVYLFGVLATNVLGRRLVSWADHIFNRIPLVKNIYTSSKQLTEAFSTTRRGTFRQTVLVEFPREDHYVIGFVTNEVKDLDGEEKVSVFIPTGFVPPAGFLLFLPRRKVLATQLTVEEAIKSIMSVGIVTPNPFPVSLKNGGPHPGGG
jgi:uncharacterized membrane protein